MKKVWSYKAIRTSPRGAKDELRGKVSAETKAEAENIVRRMGLDVVEMRESDAPPPKAKAAQSDQSESKDSMPTPEAIAPAMQQRITEGIASLSAPPLLPQSRVPVGTSKRKHSLVYGEHHSIVHMVEDLLNNKNGRVMHMAAHPDAHGRIQLVLVIEHEEK